MNETNLIDKIKVLSHSKLPQTSTWIANVILKYVHNISALTINDLSKEANCSSTAIVKFCKKLDLTGYKELVRTLSYEMDFHSCIPGVELPQDINIDFDFLSKDEQFFLDNIAFLFKNSSSMLLEAAKLINRNKDQKIFLVGKGSNLGILQTFQHYLLKLNKVTFFSLDIEIQENYINFITENDIVIFITYSGFSPVILSIYEEVIQKTKNIILITTNQKSPMVSQDHINIFAKSNEDIIFPGKGSIISFTLAVIEIIKLVQKLNKQQIVTKFPN